MYKIQFRARSGRLVTIDLASRGAARSLAIQAKANMPETHELRVRVETLGSLGESIWEDVTHLF